MRSNSKSLITDFSNPKFDTRPSSQLDEDIIISPRSSNTNSIISPRGSKNEVISPRGSNNEVISPRGSNNEVISPRKDNWLNFSPRKESSSTLSPRYDDTTSPRKKKTVIKNIKKKLKNFFNKRPSKLDLYNSKILKPEEDNLIVVSLKLNIFLIISRHIFPSLDEEGIFRMSGSSNNINKLYASFTFDVISLEDQSIHDICGAFKKYLRESPEPLIPFQHYTDFTNICRMESKEEQIEKIISLIDEFPLERRKMLLCMVYLLKRTAQKSEENKMNIKNLGIVFGPSIMRPKNEASEIDNALAYTIDTKDRSQVVEILTENCDAIFPTLEEDFYRYLNDFENNFNLKKSLKSGFFEEKQFIEELPPPQQQPDIFTERIFQKDRQVRNSTTIDALISPRGNVQVSTLNKPPPPSHRPPPIPGQNKATKTKPPVPTTQKPTLPFQKNATITSPPTSPRSNLSSSDVPIITRSNSDLSSSDDKNKIELLVSPKKKNICEKNDLPNSSPSSSSTNGASSGSVKKKEKEKIKAESLTSLFTPRTDDPLDGDYQTPPKRPVHKFRSALDAIQDQVEDLDVEQDIEGPITLKQKKKSFDSVNRKTLVKRMVKKPIKKLKKTKKSRPMDDSLSTSSIDLESVKKNEEYQQFIDALQSPNTPKEEKKNQCLTFKGMLNDDPKFKAYLLQTLKPEDMLNLITSITNYLIEFL